MNFYLVFVLAFFSLFTAYAQEQDLTISTEDVYSPDVVNPEFPNGGLKAFYEFVGKEFDKNIRNTKDGDLIVSFTINEAGELKNIRVIRDVGEQTAFEIIRVLRLSPKWKPAMRGGKPFATTLKLPFKFVKEQTSVPIAQNNTTTSKPNNEVIEVQAEFEGGKQAFFNYLKSNLKLPKLKEYGRALVSFVIDEEGKVVELKILKDPTNGPAGTEIIRVLENCPKWKPATQKGVPVRSQFTLPISLQVEKQ